MLNKIIIQGRLTRDPELRYTTSQKPVVNFSVACERDRAVDEEKPTDFLECVAWNSTAEFISKYFRKGQMIILTGRLQMRTYEDHEGKKRTAYEVNCADIYFGEPKRSDY